MIKKEGGPIMQVKRFKNISTPKKGQAAMEFLMTYGWAILVVLIAIAALYSLGVFSGGGGSSCKMDPPFACVDVAYSVVGSKVVVLTGQGIVDGAAVTVTCEGQGATTGTVNNNQQVQVALGCGSVSKGQKIKGEISISYRLQTSPIQKVSTGTFSTTAVA